jgi:hypothetical protein
MTQSAEAATLFGLDADGRFVVPHDLVEQQPVDPQDEWGADLTLTQRAFVDVLPDSVPLAARASHLTTALSEISKANSRAGFVEATQAEAHRPAIEERYGPHTDGMAEGAAYNELTGRRRARYEFFAASGVGRLALQNRQPVAADEVDTASAEDLVYTAMNRSWSGGKCSSQGL